MELSVGSQNQGLVRLQVKGDVSRVSLDNRKPLVELLGEGAYQNHVLVDMGGVTLLDSSGVNWLLVCHRLISEAGGRLVLHSLSPITQRVIGLMNLDRVLLVADDEVQALSLVKKNES